MVLFSLPGDVIKEIVYNWLQIVEWTLLDSSLNRIARKHFLSLLQEINFKRIVHENSFAVGSYYYQWTNLRGIRLDFVDVCGECDFLTSLSLDCSKVITLSLKSITDDSVVEIVNICRSLRVVELSNIGEGSNVSFSPDILCGITSISFYSCRFQHHLLQSISYLAKSLKVFISINSDWCERFEYELLLQNSDLMTYITNFQVSAPERILSALIDHCPLIERVFLRSNAFSVGRVVDFFNSHKLLNDFCLDNNEFRFYYKKQHASKLFHAFGISNAALSTASIVLSGGLTDVRLLDVKGLTSSTLSNVLQLSLLTLKTLELSDVFEDLCVDTLRSMLLLTTSLNHLKLWACSYSESDFRTLLCPASISWTMVELVNCGEVTVSLLIELLNGAPGINKLTIANCPMVGKISQDTISEYPVLRKVVYLWF